jgi:hypothetical protein
MSSVEDRVVIGMDLHKRSVTLEVMAGIETILGGARFAKQLSRPVDEGHYAAGLAS